MNEFMPLSTETRKLCRLAAGMGARDTRPVIVERGSHAPKEIGRGYYHTNKSGDIVHYPNAYGYRTVYHASTRRVVVGHRWLARRGLIPFGPVDR